MIPAATRLLTGLFESSLRHAHGALPQHGALWHATQAAANMWRPFSAAAAKEEHGVLAPFLAQNAITPAVEFAEGLEQAPTALSWLRRRGPRTHHGALFRAFRERQVRLFDGQRVVRVKPGRVLAPGDMLLYPRDLLAGQRALPGQGWGLSSSEHSSGSQRLEHGSSSSSHQAGEGGRAASHATASSSGCSLAATQLPHRSLSQHAAGTQLAASPAPVAPAPVHPGQAAGLPPLVKAPGLVDPHTITPALMRSWVLEATNDIIFINKPAGVPVQGRNSLDAHMRVGLRLNSRDEPRLVHRLDRNVSGVMAVARSASGAAWLSAALRLKAGQASSPDRDHREMGALDDGGGKVGVRRVYWALVSGALQPGREGSIRFPLLVNGAFKNAVTYYRVRHSHPGGLSWVELEPVTGRRHQLRVHCAKVLGAPIVGDVLYGYEGVRPHKALARALEPGWWGAYSPQTADAARMSTDRKERRRAAARAVEEARAAAMKGRRAQRDESESESEGEDEGESVAGRRRLEREQRDGLEVDAGSEEEEGAGGQDVEHVFPLFLHARKLTVRRSAREAPVRVRAPLPGYMRDVCAAMQWPLPPDST